MKTEKNCPQCGNLFDGRSNQIYCSSLCKQRSFTESKNSVSNDHKPKSIEPFKSSLDTSYKRARADEARRLESTERMKQLDFDERERERKHELEKEKQKFDHERERKKWEYDSQKLDFEKERAKWEQEIIKPEINQLINLPADKVEKIDENESDEEQKSSKPGMGSSILFAIGGLVLAALTYKPTPPPPPPAKSLDEWLQNLKKARNNRSNNGK